MRPISIVYHCSVFSVTFIAVLEPQVDFGSSVQHSNNSKMCFAVFVVPVTTYAESNHWIKLKYCY